MHFFINIMAISFEADVTGPDEYSSSQCSRLQHGQESTHHSHNVMWFIFNLWREKERLIQIHKHSHRCCLNIIKLFLLYHYIPISMTYLSHGVVADAGLCSIPVPSSQSTDITSPFLNSWMFIDDFLTSSLWNRLLSGSKLHYCIDQLKSHNYLGHI